MAFHHVYDVTRRPITGLFSVRDGSALAPGMFKALDNSRWADDGILKSRPGITEILADTNLPAGTVYGLGGPFTWGGKEVLICVVDDTASRLEVWRNEYTVSSATWGGWTECTAASGQFGDTGGKAPHYGNVSITGIDQDGFLGALIQYGERTEAPLFINFKESFAAVTVETITAPEFAKSFVPLARASGFLDVSGDAMKASWPVQDTHYNNDGTWDPTGPTTSGNISTVSSDFGNRWTLLTGTGSSGNVANPTNGDYAWFEIASTVDFSGGKQVILLVDAAADDSYFSACEIAITVGATDVIIHDPQDATTIVNELVEIPILEGDDVRMFVFPIPSDATVTAVDGIKFTVRDAASLKKAATLKIYWVAAGGKVPGETEYALAFHSTLSNTDSAGVRLLNVTSRANSLNFRNTTAGERIHHHLRNKHQGNVNPTEGASTPADFVLPIDPQVFYQYRVPILAPALETVNGKASSSSGWADRISVYRKHPDDADFYHVEDITVASYTTSWITNSSIFSGTAQWGEKAYNADKKDVSDMDFNRRLPDAFTEPIPKGQATIFAQKRLFTAAFRAPTDSDRFRLGEVKVSDEGRPMRMRTLDASDDGFRDASAGYTVPVGDEKVRILYDVSASVIGSPAVYPLTNKSMMALYGPRVERIGSVGCLAPSSAHEKDGRVFFLDHENRLRRLFVVAKDISSDTIADVLDACPVARRQFMFGIAFRERFYLAMADATNTTNSTVLVWSDKVGAFESKDTYPAQKAPQHFILWNVEDEEQKLYFMANNRKIYQIESGNDDDGATIAFKPIPGDIRSAKFDEMVKVGHVGIVADDASQVLDTKLTNLLDTDDVSEAEIDLDVETARAYRLDTVPGGAHPEIESEAVQLTISASVSNQIKIRSIGVEIEGTVLGGPDA